MKETAVISVKGFDKDLCCTGGGEKFQYEIGKTYEHKGRVEACSGGFHACENPLDVWSYYPLGTSRFCEVEQSGEISRHNKDDSKIASAVITIRAELKLPEIITRTVAWIVSKAEGNAATTGNYANAATTGNYANAATTGDYANAATTGNYANAATTGYRANAATTGDSANAATTGDYANAATTGYYANAATTGESANAATTGYYANAATTGESANAATTGNYANAATTGESAIAAALGYGAMAKAGKGGAICVVKRDDNYKIVAIRASKVGENGVKPDTWYSLSAAGEFVEQPNAG